MLIEVAGSLRDKGLRVGKAAELLSKKAFGSAGNSYSVQRIYVHESVVETFTKKWWKLRINSLLEILLDPTTDVGPLITLEEANRRVD